MTTNYALIADPDVVAAHVFLSAVRELGLGTVVVRDGTVALGTMLERGAPALLIAELALPGIDGFELIEGLRRSVSERRTPVIVVSADRDLRDRASDVRARLGIGAILARAASEDSVRRVIRRILSAAEDQPARAAAPRTTPPRRPRPAPAACKRRRVALAARFCDSGARCKRRRLRANRRTRRRRGQRAGEGWPSPAPRSRSSSSASRSRSSSRGCSARRATARCARC
jgi:CheY-like chemotaxis protein